MNFENLIYENFLFNFNYNFFISNSILAIFFNKPGEPSDTFDGVYTFHITVLIRKLENRVGDWYDGSRFIIKEGKVSNNRGGAGRYTIDVESRIDKKGTIYIKGKRKKHNFYSFGKLNKKYKEQSILLKGMWQLKANQLTKEIDVN